MEYGKKLNSGHSLRMTRGIKGTRQKVIVRHNPSEMDPNQLLLVMFPNFDSDDVMIPGTANLSFNIKLSSMDDPKRALASDIGRTIVKNLAVKFEGMFEFYQDLWKTEKWNTVRQGIIHSGGLH